MARDSHVFERSVGLADVAATDRLGARIAAGLAAGDAVALEGDLGAGKTTLARAILRALGVTEDVPSPTFTLVQLYETRHLIIRHFDLYRIERPGDVEELGLEEALGEGAALIEWPERAWEKLPSEMLHIALSVSGPCSRLASLRGPARWARAFEDMVDHVG